MGEVRTCIIQCGKSETHIGRWKEHWRNHKNGWICNRCYCKHVKHLKNKEQENQYCKEYYNKNKEYFKEYFAKRTKEYVKNNNSKRLKYKDKQIRIKQNIKTGYCSRCSNNIYDGSCNLTSLHHIRYNDDDPLKHTIELCNPCHRKQHINIHTR